jgi:hypothetical protein
VLTSFAVTNVYFSMATNVGQEISSGVIFLKSNHLVALLPSIAFCGTSPAGLRPPGFVAVHALTETDFPAF